MKHDHLDHIHQVFKSISPILPGARPHWLKSMRLRAFEAFCTQGLPTTKDEAWRYTNLEVLKQRLLRFSPPITDVEGARRIVDENSFAEASHRLVFVNGTYSPELSAVGELPHGAFIGNLVHGLQHAPEQMRSLFDQMLWSDGLVALNSAFLRDGFVVVLPPDTKLDRPLHALFLSGDEDLAVQPANAVISGARSSCAIIEQFVGLGEQSYVTNSVTHVMAGEDTEVQHYRVQQESPNAVHIGTVDVTQHEASRFSSYAFSFGGALSRSSVQVRLAASRTHTTLDGLYVAGGKQHMDHYTLMDHAYPYCSSRETYRGVLDGSARGIFNGRVIVRQDAQKTDADQSNHNLLLSRNAEVDTKPQLEIYADDVRCTHGTTVGELDEDQLFYLRARGIDEVTGRALLTFAFARDIVDRVSIAPLRKRLEGLLLARMPEGERIRRGI
jgi:Fe-S cluster assembly protein SufD